MFDVEDTDSLNEGALSAYTKTLPHGAGEGVDVVSEKEVVSGKDAVPKKKVLPGEGTVSEEEVLPQSDTDCKTAVPDSHMPVLSSITSDVIPVDEAFSVDRGVVEGQVITNKSTAAVSYPCIVLNVDGISSIKFSVLKGFLSDGAINVYLSSKGSSLFAGCIPSSKVVDLVSLFGVDHLNGWFDKDTNLAGPMIYALSD